MCGQACCNTYGDEWNVSWLQFFFFKFLKRVVMKVLLLMCIQKQYHVIYSTKEWMNRPLRFLILPIQLTKLMSCPILQWHLLYVSKACVIYFKINVFDAKVYTFYVNSMHKISKTNSNWAIRFSKNVYAA